jgi:hypothetical protein
MRVTCDRCLRRYDVPDAALKGRKIRARCKCGARIVIPSADGAQPESAPESKGRPTRWFVDITSWEPITMDERQLVRAFSAGRIDADTLVWCKGMPDWRRLRDVDQLAERLLGAPSSGGLMLSRPPSRPEVDSSDVPARAAGAPARSRTPQASYIVPSAGDTIPLERPRSLPPASESGGEQGAGERASLLDELVSHDGVGDRPSDFPPELGSARMEAGTTPASGSDVMLRTLVAPSASTSDRGPQISGRDVNAALAEAALSAPESVRGVEQGSAASEASDAVSASTLAPAADSAAADSAAADSAAAVPASSAARSTAPPRGDAPSRSETQGGKNARSRRANGSLRRSSSEETPAQKPSSLSVPPRAARAHRGRNLVLVGGALALIWVVGRATMDESTKPISARPSSEAVEAPAPGLQLPGAARNESDAPSDLSARSPEPGGSHKSEPQSEVETRPLQAQATVALQPSPAARAGEQLAAPPRAAASSAPLPVERERTKPAAASPAAAPKPPPPRPAPPPVRLAPTSAPPAAATAPVQPPPRPAPFDMALAEQQMTLAADAAANCGQVGPQRGSGQVKVLVEPWGRVLRVTHLEQGFVGTPVGICVMQAYQQLRVPAFEGGTRSLIGTFEVK